jgi:hypothetical protein
VLSRELTDDYADALFACAVLLYNRAWISNREDDIGIKIEEFETDFLVPLGSGLRNVIQDPSIWPGIWKSPIFAEAVRYSPKIPLTRCAENSIYPKHLMRAFQAEYRSIHGPNSTGRHFEVCLHEFTRLIPAISVVKLRRCGVEIGPIDAALARYLYSWPILLSKESIEMIKIGDTMINVILFHFYSSVAAGISEQNWWAQNRPKKALKAIGKGLKEKGVVPIDILADLSCMAECPLDFEDYRPSEF